MHGARRTAHCALEARKANASVPRAHSAMMTASTIEVRIYILFAVTASVSVLRGLSTRRRDSEFIIERLADD